MHQPPQRNIALFPTIITIMIISLTLPSTSRQALANPLLFVTHVPTPHDVMRQRRTHAHH